MKPSFKKRIAARKAKMAAAERRNQWLVILIVVGFLAAATFLYLKSRPPKGPININTATPAQLGRLPEVGPAMAREITRNRPFSSSEDLLNVKGIGPKTLEKIRPLVEVGN